MRLLGLITVWVVVIFGTPLVLVAFGASKDLAVWIGSGLMFGAIAHLSQSPYWKYLSNKELNPLSAKYGQSSEPRPPETQTAPATQYAKLDQPFKRISFLIFVLGIAVCLTTFVLYEIYDSYIGFLDGMFNRPTAFWGYKISMLIGLALAAGGYVCAFHYEQTIGRVVVWVRTGKVHF